VKEASLRLEMGGTVGLIEKAELRGEGVCGYGWSECIGYQGVEGGEEVVCEVATHSRWLV
jgi:hypothetical protein